MWKDKLTEAELAEHISTFAAQHEHEDPQQVLSKLCRSGPGLMWLALAPSFAPAATEPHHPSCRSAQEDRWRSKMVRRLVDKFDAVSDRLDGMESRFTESLGQLHELQLRLLMHPALRTAPVTSLATGDEGDE